MIQRRKRVTLLSSWSLSFVRTNTPDCLFIIRLDLASFGAHVQANVQAALKRGEDINTLEDKSVDIVKNAERFKDVSHDVKMMFCKKHYRNIAIIVVILTVRIRWRF